VLLSVRGCAAGFGQTPPAPLMTPDSVILAVLVSNVTAFAGVVDPSRQRQGGGRVGRLAVPPPAPPIVIARLVETVAPVYDRVAAEALPTVMVGVPDPVPKELAVPEFREPLPATLPAGY